MNNPKDFFLPLAVGAPDPLRSIPATASRMIHFFDPANQKMVAKLPALARQADVLLGNLEDAIEADRKELTREALVEVARTTDLQGAELWARINALNSPWILDDLTRLVGEVGDRIDVLMVPKVESAQDIHYLDRIIAQLEARAGLTRPILLHPILETSRGVVNVEEICLASPRIQGLSFGPADLAADRQMKLTAAGGSHDGYLVRASAEGDDFHGPRVTAQQDLWHYTLARMIDACRMAGVHPYYGPFGDIKDVVGCEDQFRAAYILGCVGAWSLHPVQIDIARKVFTPDAGQVHFARRVVEALKDGTGAAMIDGKMQDDATYKQSQVVLRYADLVAQKDAALQQTDD